MGFDVLVKGFYDQFLADSIIAVCSKKRNDIFIDIGANIGLVTIQVGSSFKRIIALEPNPIAFGVLQANTLIHFSESKLSLRNYGLGCESTVTQIEVPDRNLGGAFIKSSENRLTELELAKKEGGDIKVIQKLKVTIKSASDFFRMVRMEVPDAESRIVIKIDVEGMEEPILRALFNSELWCSREVICFFETWSNELKTDLITLFGRNIFAQPKNKMQWLHPSEINNLEATTELCIWSPAIATPSLRSLIK